MTASLAATATAAAASSIVARTANSVSMTATIDRSSSSSSNVVASATTTMATTTAATTSPVVLACSPVDTEEWSKKSTNQHSSLQARLETKRKAQTHNRQGPLDADGYPLCQYRKSFFGHLTVKNFITSVRLRFTSSCFDPGFCLNIHHPVLVIVPQPFRFGL